MPSDEVPAAVAPAAEAGPGPFATLRTFRTIVWVAFDEHGQVTGANRGFELLAPQRDGVLDPQRAAAVFVDPTVGELLARTPDAEGVVYQGLFTISGRDDRSLSLRGAATRRGDGVTVLAEHAAEETEAALRAVLRLNEELADTQRELVLARRRLEAREEALRTLAATDALTGLTNRRAFLEHLEAAVGRVARGHPAAVLMIDVDRFKETNDRLGHPAGDAHLVAVADALRGAVRASDVPARFAGDEFVVLLADASLAAAAEVGERVLATAAGARADLVPDGVALSIGAIALRPGERAHEAIARADRALYTAKHGGRGRVVAVADDPGPGATSDPR